MEQVQCPNCGGFWVKFDKFDIDTKTFKRTPHLGKGCQFIIFLLGCLFFFGMGFFTLNGGGIIGTILGLSLLLVGGLTVFGFVADVGKIRANRITEIQCTCRTCGKMWNF